MVEPNNLEMMGDYVLIRPEEEVSKESSIMIPESAKSKKATSGTVLKKGPGIRNTDGKFSEMPFDKGYKVFFTEWAGKQLKWNNEDLVVMKESDIFAFVKEGEK